RLAARVGDDGELRHREMDARERLAHRLHGRRHERRMEGARDLQPYRLRAAASRELLCARDRGEGTREHGLLWRVLVRDRERVAAAGGLTHLARLVEREAHERGL